MKQLTYYIRLSLKFIQRYSKTLVAGLTVLAVILLTLFWYIQSASKPVIVEGLVGTYTPDNLPPFVTSLLSQGLVGTDVAGKPYPNLSARWTSNQNATVYTFTLKDNLYWSDGTKLKAPDINLAVPEATSAALDDYTLQFTLNDSFSPFPTLLTKAIFKNGTNIGTGPYQISGMQTTTVFIEKLTLTPMESDLPTVVLKFYPSDDIAKEALERGDIQALVGLNDPSAFAGQSPYRILSQPNYTRLVTIFYNTADKVLSDRNFRLALSFAAPEIKGETTAVTSLPPTSWAFNPNVRDYLNNPDQAKLYFSKVKDPKDEVTLTATTSLESVGKQVVAAWRKQGIQANLKIESGIPQNFQALLIAQDIPVDPDQYSLWHSTQTETNISKISSPRIDQDLEDGRKSIDSAVRSAKYQDFQKVLLDESPAAFLYFSKFNVVTLKKDTNNLEKVLHIQFPTYHF